MRAIVLHEPGDLRIDQREQPTPAPGQVLVRIERGGICGSDLHYYRHGGFGTVRMREPLTLGHEIAGRVAAHGPGVAGPPIGTLVAVNPSMPCGKCEFCRGGLRIHCSNMRFLGSAMRVPHVQAALPIMSPARRETPFRSPPGWMPAWRPSPSRWRCACTRPAARRSMAAAC